jgi:hypothetical protein
LQSNNIELDLDALAATEKKHERLWANDPEAERLVVVRRDSLVDIPWRERMNDPSRMFEAEMQGVRYHLETGDDSLPTCRVEFGTGLMASVFGVEMLVTDSGCPFASHDTVVKSIADLKPVEEIDPMKEGELGHLYEHMAYFKKHLPAGVHLSQADLQGPWNTAHLIRGNDIFTDVYDYPELVEAILDHVTRAMQKVVQPMKEFLGEPTDAYYLHGAKSRGGGRICNCTTDMISPGFYRENILKFDGRFLDSIDGGFVHICGNNSGIVTVFNDIQSLTGLEFNFNYIDLWEISDLLRPDCVLMCSGPVDPPLQTPLGAATLERLFKGELPSRKNIIFSFNDPSSLDYAKRLVGAVRSSNC